MVYATNLMQALPNQEETIRAIQNLDLLVVVGRLARVANLEWGRATIDEVDGSPVITISSDSPDPAQLLSQTHP